MASPTTMIELTRSRADDAPDLVGVEAAPGVEHDGAGRDKA